jgi:hypothetical protein
MVNWLVFWCWFDNSWFLWLSDVWVELGRLVEGWFSYKIDEHVVGLGKNWIMGIYDLGSEGWFKNDNC